MGNVRFNPARGKLFLDFRVGSCRYREYTALADSANNRKRLKRLLARIDEAITTGTFRYEDFFANPGDGRSENAKPPGVAEGPKTAESAASTRSPIAIAAVTPVVAPTFEEYAKSWIVRADIVLTNPAD